MEWINANKEWLFSGILVSVPLALIGWLVAARSIKKKNQQRQRSGKNSINLQAGGDIKISGGVGNSEKKPRKR